MNMAKTKSNGKPDNGVRLEHGERFRSEDPYRIGLDAIALLETGQEQDAVNAVESVAFLPGTIAELVMCKAMRRFKGSEPLEKAIDSHGTSGLNSRQLIERAAVELASTENLTHEKFLFLQSMIAEFLPNGIPGNLIHNKKVRVNILASKLARAKKDPKTGRELSRALFHRSGKEREATLALIEMVPFLSDVLDEYRPTEKAYPFRVLQNTFSALERGEASVGFFVIFLLVLLIVAATLLPPASGAAGKEENPKPPGLYEALEEALTSSLEKLNDSDILLLPDEDAALAAECLTQSIHGNTQIFLAERGWGQSCPPGTQWILPIDMYLLNMGLETDELNKVILVNFEASRIGRRIVFERLWTGERLFSVSYAADAKTEPGSDYYLEQADQYVRIERNYLADLFYRMAIAASGDCDRERGESLLQYGVFLHSKDEAEESSAIIKEAISLLPECRLKELPAAILQKYQLKPTKESRISRMTVVKESQANDD